MNGIDWRRVFIVAGAIVVALFLLWFAWHIPRTITLFLIAAFIAFGVNPIVTDLEKRRIPRAIAVTLVFTILILLGTVGLVIIVPLAVAQAQILAGNFPGIIQASQAWIVSVETWLHTRLPGVVIPAFNLNQFGGAQAASVVSGAIASLGTILYNAATALLIGFTALILSFLFLVSSKQIGEAFAGLFPQNRRATARRAANEITHVFGSYISGQVIVSAITGAVVALASALIGFKFSLILGLITAVAYAIPVIGMLIAQIIAAVLCAPQGLWIVIWVQVIMFGMARISDNVLVPKIMGDAVGVSPIAVIFAVFAGGELLGVPGLVLGIPAAALIRILWRYFVGPWLHGTLETPEPAGAEVVKRRASRRGRPRAP
jgi:predicted PurR-regulated permease PerM